MRGSEVKLGSEALKALECIAKGNKAVVRMTGKNKGGGNYSYLSQQDFAELDDLILDNGCVLLISVVDSHMEAGNYTVTSKAGTPSQRMLTQSHCMLEGRLQSVSNPNDYVSVYCSGFKLDYNDKANGAQTIARRYIKMHLFNIPTDGTDEPDQQPAVNDGSNIFATPAAPTSNLFASTEDKSVANLFTK